jgi:hypothetical protein
LEVVDDWLSSSIYGRGGTMNRRISCGLRHGSVGHGRAHSIRCAHAFHLDEICGLRDDGPLRRRRRVSRALLEHGGRRLGEETHG